MSKVIPFINQWGYKTKMTFPTWYHLLMQLGGYVVLAVRGRQENDRIQGI